MGLVVRVRYVRTHLLGFQHTMSDQGCGSSQGTSCGWLGSWPKMRTPTCGFVRIPCWLRYSQQGVRHPPSHQMPLLCLPLSSGAPRCPSPSYGIRIALWLHSLFVWVCAWLLGSVHLQCVCLLVVEHVVVNVLVLSVGLLEYQREGIGAARIAELFLETLFHPGWPGRFGSTCRPNLGPLAWLWCPISLWYLS